MWALRAREPRAQYGSRSSHAADARGDWIAQDEHVEQPSQNNQR
jgi:hypothetical protein